MGAFCIQPLFHLLQYFGEVLKRYAPAVFVKDLYKATHVSPFVITGEVDVHIYLGNGLLLPHIFVKYSNGIADPFYANLVNVYVSVVYMILYAFPGRHFQFNIRYFSSILSCWQSQ